MCYSHGARKRACAQAGDYEVMVRPSSEDIRLRGVFRVKRIAKLEDL